MPDVCRDFEGRLPAVQLFDAANTDSVRYDCRMIVGESDETMTVNADDIQGDLHCSTPDREETLPKMPSPIPGACYQSLPFQTAAFANGIDLWN